MGLSAVLFMVFSGGWAELQGQAVSAPEWDMALADFSARLAEDVRADGVGGITAGVVVGRDLVWAQGFGWADTEKRIPAGVNTIYRTGSISKSFTAVALLQLCERGYLSLQDPVESVLPELSGVRSKPPDSVPVTFQHLASHTAGLIREPLLEGAAAGPLEEWESQLLASVPTTEFFAPPGETYQYSNIGFGILGYSLSRATGIPFMELVTSSIIRPLGMGSTGFTVTAEMAEHLSTGYENRRDGSIDAETPAREHTGRGYKVPNGGVYSTVGDLARFIAGLTGAATVPLLGPESRALIRKSHTPPDSSGRYSLGFRLWARDDITLVGHTGSVSGYTAAMLFEPESQIGVVLLRNYAEGATNLSGAGADLLVRLLGAEAGG
jgi:CubicO group peptidase (beta-lactamase class C family)